MNNENIKLLEQVAKNIDMQSSLYLSFGREKDSARLIECLHGIANVVQILKEVDENN